MKRVAVFICIMLAMVTVICTSSFAAFPDKPITLVCWSSAGSSHDLMARIIAKVGEKYIGQPIAVLNKTGGKGIIAMKYVLGKKADGYTIMTNTRSMTEVLTDPNSNPNLSSFKYISQAVIDPFVILVRKESKFNTLEDLIAYAKQNPGALNIGGYGVQSVDELLVNRLMEKAEIKLNYIPYQGGMEPVVAALGGHVDVAVANPGEMISNFQAGTVRVLATASSERFTPFDQAPTLKELGLDIVEEHWRGLMASNETPDAIIAVLDAAFEKVINDPEFIQFAKQSSMYAGYMPSAEFEKLVLEQAAYKTK